MGLLDRGIEIKTPEQIDAMRKAGLVVGSTLELLRGHVRAGISTAELDGIAEDNIRSAGATPSFLGYHGFPASICASVNDEVVHGIPGDRVLADGDVISIDCGAIVDGWHGDAAITVAVGAVPAEVTALMEVTEQSMWRGIAAAHLGGRVTDISHAVERHVRGAGPVRDRRGLHRPRHRLRRCTSRRTSPTTAGPGKGPRLVPGLALAVEPMITLGTKETDLLEDDWTVVTTDGSWAAHFEHTFTITPEGTWVLTALDGGEQQLTELGVRFGGR